MNWGSNTFTARKSSRSNDHEVFKQLGSTDSLMYDASSLTGTSMSTAPQAMYYSAAQIATT